MVDSVVGKKNKRAVNKTRQKNLCPQEVYTLVNSTNYLGQMGNKLFSQCQEDYYLIWCHVSS